MKSILSSKSSANSKDDDAKTRALAAIERLGHQFHSTALISLAYRASSDPFGKVRGMVEDMIAKLQSEAAKEATQKAFCDEEMGKSTASKDEKEEKLEKTNSRIEKAESGIAKLSEAVGTLSSEISEIDSVTSEATKLRQSESAAFRVAEKDFSESQEACAQAIEVLREYYEGAAAVLVQVDAHSSRDGSGIIGLLEVAESDFAKMLADARTAEDAANSEFKKLSQENKLAKATKEAERKGKESEVKSLKTVLSSGNEDKEGISTELDAVLQYLAELKPQCETKAPSYAEKKAKRDAEIAGLKDALNILSESA
jgi:chromosome segregation ATPase